MSSAVVASCPSFWIDFDASFLKDGIEETVERELNIFYRSFNILTFEGVEQFAELLSAEWGQSVHISKIDGIQVAGMPVMHLETLDKDVYFVPVNIHILILVRPFLSY